MRVSAKAIHVSRLFLGLLLLFSVQSARLESAEPSINRADVEHGLRRSIDYFTRTVAVHGGYVYYQSLDGSRRLGEGIARPSQVWVQPPGTPAVGLAILEAYLATGEAEYRKGAEAAAGALLYGQLASGGWANMIDFNTEGAAKYRDGRGKQKGRNYSTFDDDISQSALRFLIRADKAFDFQHAAIHEAVQYGLDAVLKAQYPNGAFPQVWDAAVKTQPVVKANYPSYDWRTENRIKEYWHHYTLNDDLAGDMTDLLILADQTYGGPQGDGRFVAALKRLGDFLILAQMPEPQPAWAQQYNFDMQPAWARKFEPAAISGRETQDVLLALIRIADHTGDQKYLAPLPLGVSWLKASSLSDGQIARFYELKSNRPLYMNDRYELTYDDSNVPSHYGWKGSSGVAKIEREWDRVVQGKPSKGVSKPTAQEIRAILDSLDGDGRWVSRPDGTPLVGQPKFGKDEPYLSSEVFAKNVTKLSAYLADIK